MNYVLYRNNVLPHVRYCTVVFWNFIYLPGGIFSGGDDNIVRQWDQDSGVLYQSFAGHTSSIRCMAVTVDRKHILSAGYDKSILQWDLSSGHKLTTFRSSHTELIHCLAVSPDGLYFASGDQNGRLKLWLIDSSQPKEVNDPFRTFDGDFGAVLAVIFSSDGNRVFSGHESCKIIVWQTATCRNMETWRPHSSGVSTLARIGSTLLVSGSWDLTIKLLNPEDGTVIRTIISAIRPSETCDYVTSVAVTPDGARIISGHGSSAVKVWDTASGSHLQDLWHSDWVTAVAVSDVHGSMLIASASRDRTIKVWCHWDHSFKCIQTLRGHSDWLRAVVFL
jgi:WD40 repeat protein